MLTENKFSNYLIYAVGEIVLVVIGILIALQINTWNESRKERALRKNYSNALLIDFKSDTLRIRQYLDRVRSDSAEVALLETRLQSEQATYDTLAHIFRSEFNPFVSSFSVSSATLNSLITTGDIGLYPDSIRADLTIIARRQTWSQQNNSLSVDKYLTLLNESTKDFPLDNYFVDLNPKFRDDIWNAADTLKMAGSLDRILDWKLVYNRNEIGFFSQLYRETSTAIKTLNQLEGIE